MGIHEIKKIGTITHVDLNLTVWFVKYYVWSMFSYGVDDWTLKVIAVRL